MTKIDVTKQSIMDIVRISVVDCIEYIQKKVCLCNYNLTSKIIHLTHNYFLYEKNGGTRNTSMQSNASEEENVAEGSLMVHSGGKEGVHTKHIPLDLTDMKSTIFSSGITEGDAIVMVCNVLNLLPCNHNNRTKHKNFVRAMCHLIIYIHYLNGKGKYLLSMVGNGMGYIDQFDSVRPIQKDTEYNEKVRVLMEKAIHSPGMVRCVWHPTSGNMEQWVGKMKNFFYAALRTSFNKGLFNRDQEPVEGGLFQEWYDILQSIGVKID